MHIANVRGLAKYLKDWVSKKAEIVGSKENLISIITKKWIRKLIFHENISLLSIIIVRFCKSVYELNGGNELLI